MAEVLTIETDDITAYLGITVSTYDVQIAAILAAWGQSIEDMIHPGYLANTALESRLTLGKTLVLCGQVLTTLPAGASASQISQKKIGDYAITYKDSAKQAGGKTKDLTEQGWDMLAPYLTADATAAGLNQFKSSTQDYAAEATLTRRDSSGEIVTLGTLEGW